MYDITRAELKKHLDELADNIANAICKRLDEDEQGRIWFCDKDGNRLEIFDDGELKTDKSTDERKVIEEASELSLQKKEQRLMVNLPEWLKDRLQKRAKRTGKSMNEIIRLALTQYLAK